MEPRRKAFSASPFSLVLIFLLSISTCSRGKESSSSDKEQPHEGPVVEKDQRRTVLTTEFGEISATDVKGGHRAPPYHLQFFTLDPNSVFLPVLLHTDMIFYVHTGSGELTWANEGHSSSIHLREGDLCTLTEGTVFYIQSNLEAERRKLRIYAIFASTEDSTYDPLIGAYSRINKLVKGFDKKIMQAAFKVPEDLIEAITNKTETPAIVHAVPEKKGKKKKKDAIWELETSLLRNFLGFQFNSKKIKAYNIFDHGPDFENPNGWTLTVTKKQLKSLKRHNIGFLMVNLTAGSMLGPHWNPRATEINVVLQGEGMVRVVCGSSNDDKKECQNKRFKVKQGDVFVVPRYHPMAQMSLRNGPLVFLGFSTASKENHPQFLAGGNSMLKNLDRKILATSFNVSEESVDQLLASRDESVIFGCDSCAEEEERIMKEEKEKEEEEEEKGKKEEEEEKEEEEREKEEEESKKRQEEEEREAARKREEQRKREEEEARRQQEERERRREEEEARRQREREEEARREREREEEARREKEREEEEEEEAARREKEEEAESEEEAAKRQQEKRERRREEEEKRRREEEAAEEERRREEQAAAEKEAEAARRKRERRREEEEKRRREEEAAEEERRREEQAAAEKEAEAARRKRERRREEEEAESEEEAAKRQQEKRERRREEEEARREQEKRREERKEREQGEEEAESEEEAARRQQEQRERRREEEEARREHKRRREERTEREQESRRGGGEEEEEAEGEEAAARRQQERRERRREEEEERRDEQADRERGGGRRRRQKRGEHGRSREETEAEWEQEEAMRQQEERERRREQGRFEGRRVLKMRYV